MHQALYRKWRPQTFDDVCGQEHITSILRYEAENRAFSHAYLFCGSRGTGKTTCAKILAKVVNCESPVNGNPCGKCAACLSIESGAATDVLEMDAASNNGVDNIRDIRDEVVYAPSALRYRVYIIDEVHMLSISAFNALLKTLEEPPEHVIFILATTELHKLPSTIVSRCQRFDFRRISTETLMARLQFIAAEEKIRLDEDASRMLAKLAQGGMRDAISLLELCAGGGREVTLDVVEDAIGLTGRDSMLKTVLAVADKNYDLLFSQIDEVVRSSKDIAVFWQDLIAVYRDMLVVKTTQNASAYLDLTDHEAEQLGNVAKRFRKETLLYHCNLLEDAFFAMQKANAVKRIVAEMALVRMCDEALDSSSEALLSRIAQLEEKMITGGFSASARRVEPEAVPVREASEKPMEAPVKKAPTKIETPVPSAAPIMEMPASKPQQTGERRVLKPMRNWMEAVEKICRSDPMSAGFVKNAKAFTMENGNVVVRFPDPFSFSMMEKDDARDRLRMALSTVLRREVGDRMLIMEIAGEQKNASVIDEILEASDSD
ncbi:MAG: DNA polymerase III subunit gamma/tau [Clostridia bacterium]|nr:DNA polymerase III subunit gamma/tau [Clostridia bacterium]